MRAYLPAAEASTLVELDVNGELVAVRAALSTSLLTALRDELHLTAAKRGCNQGVCGACTVRVDGVPMRSCLSLAHGCIACRVTTLEGLAGDPRMQVLQRAFAEAGGFQCGFCTPGMLVAAHALLEYNADPDEAAIRGGLSGNLCRCTGYVKIVAAVRLAVRSLGEAT